MNLCDILDYDDLVFIAVGTKHFPQITCFGFGSHRTANGIASLKEYPHDPYSDIAICTSNEYFRA
jgi:hypothetical protein